MSPATKRPPAAPDPAAAPVRASEPAGVKGRVFAFVVAGFLGLRERARHGLAVAGWCGFAGWCGLLVFLSTRPGRAYDPGRLSFLQQNWDKAAHFVYFAVGGFCLASAWAYSLRWRKRMVFLVCYPALLAVALLDEWVQTFVPLRQGADPRDFASDAAGALVGVLVAIWFYERIRKRFGAG